MYQRQHVAVLPVVVLAGERLSWFSRLMKIRAKRSDTGAWAVAYTVVHCRVVVADVARTLTHFCSRHQSSPIYTMHHQQNDDFPCADDYYYYIVTRRTVVVITSAIFIAHKYLSIACVPLPYTHRHHHMQRAFFAPFFFPFQLWHNERVPGLNVSLSLSSYGSEVCVLCVV